MPFLQYLTLAVTHPFEARTLIQFYLWHAPKRDITSLREHPTSGWDRESMRACWGFLDKTSRSFAAVIKELDGDLARIICLFYLVLRGLDTIEDDMTIPDDVKQPLLRSFHQKLSVSGWKFDGNGPDEADRQLLVEFDNVVTEMGNLDSNCREVITDICQKMQTGMADFCHKAAASPNVYLETTADYDLYCHYVAGLVGEGLSRLFSASEKEVEWLGEQLVLSNSMGLLLQKTNITRDYAEDVDQGRYFWPREIWGAHGFSKLEELKDPAKEKNALFALNAMVINALGHSVDALDYLSLLKNQSVFNFCAIPATMALATLALCYNNPDVLHKNVKIRKAHAADLMMRSKNPRDVAYMFRDSVRAIHAKASIEDPNFVQVGVMCGKIEQWCEHHFPSFLSLNANSGKPEMNAEDARYRTVERDIQRDAAKAALAKRQPAPTQGRPAEEGFPMELIFFAAMAFGIVLFVSGGLAYVMIRWAS